jgi:hypothetical protein
MEKAVTQRELGVSVCLTPRLAYSVPCDCALNLKPTRAAAQMPGEALLWSVGPVTTDAEQRLRALMQRKKIVVPITVGVGSKVRRTAGRSHNTDIRAFAGPRIDHVKGVCTRVDAGNHLFARPFPRRVSVRIAWPQRRFSTTSTITLLTLG